jgi:SAM-dependent methyltransferase
LHTEANAEQIAYWNDVAGERWARLQNRIDAMFEPLTQAALAHAAPRRGAAVLDVGCGTGATTVALAELAGPEADVAGIDVSAPMLAAAEALVQERKLKNVRFFRADAMLHRFETPAADLLFSRFGVMFFDDPIRAFTNLRSALEPGGRVSFVCWRSAADNPFFRVPLAAALPLLGPQEPADPHAPGPMAFAQADRVRHILESSGYDAVRIAPLESTLIAGGPGARRETTGFLMQIGPVARALGGRDVETRNAIADALADALDEALRPYETADGVRFPAGLWLVDAVNPK